MAARAGPADENSVAQAFLCGFKIGIEPRSSFENFEACSAYMAKFLSYNFWQTLADHHLDRLSEHGTMHLYRHPRNAYRWSFEPKDVEDGDVVFVKTDFLDFFVANMLPYIRTSFTLITPSIACTETILDNVNVCRWMAMHMSIHHPKLTHIPIGLAEPDSPIGDQRIVQECMTKHVDKKPGVFVPPMGASHPVRSRIDALDHPMLIRSATTHLPFCEYLKKVAEYTYVLCPVGNGLDIHRVYEALLMKTVPIYVANEGIVPGMYIHLPVIVVDTVDDVSRVLDSLRTAPRPSIDWEHVQKYCMVDLYGSLATRR